MGWLSRGVKYQFKLEKVVQGRFELADTVVLEVRAEMS